MKALTVYQPWASLIMIRAKPFEFRGWDFSARYPKLVGQRIVIHASARPVRPAEVLDVLKRLEDGSTGLKPEIARPLLDRLAAAHKGQGILELSAGLGTVVIAKARRVRERVADSDRLDHGLYGWPMVDPQPFDHPRPMRGAQGFWNWPEGA